MPEEASNRTSHRHSTASATSSSKKRRRALETSSSNSKPIVDLFAANQHSTPSRGSDKLGDSDQESQHSKRAKTSSRGTIRESSTPVTSMYSFTKSKGHEIDLTSGSPTPPSPLARKIQKVSIVGPQVGARRLVVRNIRSVKPDTQKYFGTVSEKLNSALDSILSQQEQTPLLLEELYQGVKNVCKQGHGSELRVMLTKKMESHASDTVKPRILAQIETDSSSTESLRTIVREWSIWKNQWQQIKSIFFYMDPAPVFVELSINLFLQDVMSDKEIMTITMSGIVDILMAHRRGQSADPELCRQGVEMCIELNLYTKSLELSILRESQAYFASWSDEKLGTEDLSGYLHAVFSFLEAELNRCDLFKLSSSTKQKLERQLEEAAIKKHQKRLADTDDVMKLLDADNEDDLKLLYNLLGRCKLSDSLKHPLEAWIKSRGEQIVFDLDQEDNMVVRLITLRKQTDRIWQNSLMKDKEFALGLRKAFEHVMNKTKKSAATHNTDNTKQGEMIAKFVDFLLRGGSKVIPSSLTQVLSEDKDEDFENDVENRESVLDEQLDQVLDIFRFLHGKAVFEEFYKKDLAKRLLMGRSASADAELSMLARLKTECGESFTQNLETMFKDIELSREEMSEQKAREMESGSTDAIDFSVNVLSASAWPSYPEITLNLPSQISRLQNKFEVGYKHHHRGRTLHWKHSLAHVQLKATFPSGRKELVVSGFQAIILLLFNDIGAEESLTYQQLAEATKLPEADLDRTLQSLACAKLRPLRKHPQGRDINKSDTFSINKTFTHPKYRIKINQVQLRETKEENKQTHERVLADREFETQAAIVRIMKGKKTITHTLLVTEVIDATKKRGVLSMAEIKKQIERLIEKDYMERIDGNTYSYVA